MSTFIGGLLTAAVAVFVVGTGLKILRYARTPVPLKIPTMPAPLTRRGVLGRLLREVVLFESLFKASRWTWIFGWLFHAGLLLAVLTHLRYFTEPVWWWVALIAPLGKYAGVAMVVGLGGLLGRRLLVDRVRYISAPSDFLMLLLLLGIAGSGLLMRYVAHTDIVALKQFTLGLVALAPTPLPGSVLLMLHLALVAVLLLIFPFSKLMHAPGLFFSPSRNQVDNSREVRHVNVWSPRVDAKNSAGVSDGG